MRKIRLSVKNDSIVPYKQTIYGRGHGPLQIYVLSNDGLYYLQDPPEYGKGGCFSIDCAFGLSADSLPIKSGYEVIVVRSKDRPTSPVKEMPKGVLKRVRVWREV